MFRIIFTAALAALAGPALSATLMTATFEGVVTADRTTYSQTDAAGRTVTAEEGGLAAGTAFVATFTYLAQAAGCSVDLALCGEYEPQVHYTPSLISAVIPVLGFHEINDRDLRHNGVFTRLSEEDPAGRTFGLQQNAYVSGVDGEGESWSEDWIQYGFGGLVHAPFLAVDLTAPFSQAVDPAGSPWSVGYFSHDQGSLLTGTGEGWRRERDTAFRIDRFGVAPAQAAVAALPAPVHLPASVLLLGGGIGIMALKRARR